jgi:hypothetical protein
MIVRPITVARVASVLIALAYLAIVLAMPALKKGDPNPYAYGLYVVGLCLACIWFPEAMGSLRWYRLYPMEETPGCIVSAVGWLILAVIFALAVIGWITGYPYR